MSVSDSIFRVYQEFYAQKKILTEAPALTIDVNQMGVAEFPVDKALNELAGVVSYLLGLRDVRQKSYEELANLIQTAYDGQDFWQNLLYDYLEMTLDLEEANLKKQGENLQDEMAKAMDDFAQAEEDKEAIIAHFADKITAKKFHVDAKALIRNFFKMMCQDEKQAWSVLITNPAYFSPIQTQDENGKVILTPKQAISENKELAHFLKKLKG